MKEHYIEVNGWHTRYVCAGERGPALVLLHGLGASLESWLLNVDALSDEFRVYAPDLIYFGKSAKPARDPTYADFEKFVCAFMDAVGIARATLIGNSMGGAIAARTAISAPERVQKLVLAAPAGFGRELVWWLRLRSVWDLRPRGAPSPWMIQLGLRQLFYKPERAPSQVVTAIVGLNQEPGYFDAYRQVIRLGVDWRGVKDALVQEVRDAARQVRVPTLLVWGKQDRVVPVQQLDAAKKYILHARAMVLDECGHAPQIEHPEKFNALVRAFVREEAL